VKGAKALADVKAKRLVKQQRRINGAELLVFIATSRLE
jgi:hypothetical protein